MSATPNTERFPPLSTAAFRRAPRNAQGGKQAQSTASSTDIRSASLKASQSNSLENGRVAYPHASFAGYPSLTPSPASAQQPMPMNHPTRHFVQPCQGGHMHRQVPSMPSQVHAASAYGSYGATNTSAGLSAPSPMGPPVAPPLPSQPTNLPRDSQQVAPLATARWLYTPSLATVPACGPSPAPVPTPTTGKRRRCAEEETDSVEVPAPAPKKPRKATKKAAGKRKGKGQGVVTADIVPFQLEELEAAWAADQVMGASSFSAGPSMLATAPPIQPPVLLSALAPLLNLAPGTRKSRKRTSTATETDDATALPPAKKPRARKAGTAAR
ncbi:hypothetical protein BKA93DRAFT_616720 [Sparassis latifolia]